MHDPETGKPFVLLDAERDFLRYAFDTDANGRLLFPEQVYAAPKKLYRNPLHRMGSFFGLVTSMPRDLARLIKDARHGRMRVDLDLKRLDKLRPSPPQCYQSRDHRHHDGIARSRLLHRDDGGGRADPVRRAAANLFRVVRLSDRFREQPLDHPFDLAFQPRCGEMLAVAYQRSFGMSGRSGRIDNEGGIIRRNGQGLFEATGSLDVGFHVLSVSWARRAVSAGW